MLKKGVCFRHLNISFTTYTLYITHTWNYISYICIAQTYMKKDFWNIQTYSIHIVHICMYKKDVCFKYFNISILLLWRPQNVYTESNHCWKNLYYVSYWLTVIFHDRVLYRNYLHNVYYAYVICAQS